ncbi:MAG: hypothetical protein QNJ98_13660 [Planctomycetota bacterium]|nr:hypothetical protein [Planctomycetota bacterium]
MFATSILDHLMIAIAVGVVGGGLVWWALARCRPRRRAVAVIGGVLLLGGLGAAIWIAAWMGVGWK